VTPAFLVKLGAATAAVFLALDIAWLGFIAKGFYARQMGHLLRDDVRWPAALAFYLIYVAAIVVLCVLPAVEKQSLSRAIGTGALLGLAAYAAFDLTALALLRDFPLRGALVDLGWGTALTASVSAVSYLIARALSA
jgi:uncharacterized membrane protein